MALSTRAMARALHTDVGPKGAKALLEWMKAIEEQNRLLLQKLDADTGVGDTDYEATLTKITE